MVKRDAPKTHHFLMLLALLAEDAHGLGIAREVERLSLGRVRLWPATLYGSLEDLQALGWIEELDEPHEKPKGAGERKRFYRITPAGRRVARGETRRLADLVQVARTRVRGAREGARGGEV
jgi:DNA-binding PadR family transcriptional regulator